MRKMLLKEQKQRRREGSWVHGHVREREILNVLLHTRVHVTERANGVCVISCARSPGLQYNRSRHHQASSGFFAFLPVPEAAGDQELSPLLVVPSFPGAGLSPCSGVTGQRHHKGPGASGAPCTSPGARCARLRLCAQLPAKGSHRARSIQLCRMKAEHGDLGAATSPLCRRFSA